MAVPLPVHRLGTLPERLSRYPTPVGGLALGVASLGLVWEAQGPVPWAAEAAAGFAAVLLVLLAIRFVLHPATLAHDLGNPVAGAVVPTFAMAWMTVSVTLRQAAEPLGALVWLTAVVLHAVFLAAFLRHQARSFRLERMVPAWFVPPVGIIVAAVTFRGAQDGLGRSLAEWALAFGMVAYAVMLPIMFYRFIFESNVPPAAMPTIAILAAPASLSMVGYLALVEPPDPVPVLILEGIAVLMTLIVLVAFTRLLVLPFSPGYAAFTFPLAISATAQFAFAEQLSAWDASNALTGQFEVLARAELWVATVVTAYVVLRFAAFAWQHWGAAHGAGRAARAGPRT
jgi:tellurite resistance protein TehA-like permease